MRRLFITLLAFLVIIFAAALAIGEFSIRPSKHLIAVANSDLKLEDITFKDNKNRKVSGWLLEGVAKRGVILLLHGIRSDRRSMLGRARALAKEGYSILLIDLQAHGESEGQNITFGLEESHSVIAAVKYLTQKYPEKPLGIIGSSLGAASAIFAANSIDVEAYVFEAVFSSLPKALKNRLKLKLGNWGQYLSPLLLWQLPWRLGAQTDYFDVADKIRNVSSSVFIIAGENDQRTTLEESKLIFENANEPKTMWTVPNAPHVDLHHYSPAEYERKVLDFLDLNMRSK